MVAASLKTDGESVANPSFCFGVMNYSMKQTANSVEVTIEAHNKKTYTCSDLHMFSTGGHFHFTNIFLPGKHVYTFENLEEADMLYIKTLGVQAFRFCDSIEHLLPNIFWTASLFLGGLGTNPWIPFFGSKPPQYM